MVIPLPDCDECRRLVGMRGNEGEIEKNELGTSWLCWEVASLRNNTCSTCQLVVHIRQKHPEVFAFAMLVRDASHAQL